MTQPSLLSSAAAAPVCSFCQSPIPPCSAHKPGHALVAARSRQVTDVPVRGINPCWYSKHACWNHRAKRRRTSATTSTRACREHQRATKRPSPHHFALGKHTLYPWMRVPPTTASAARRFYRNSGPCLQQLRCSRLPGSVWAVLRPLCEVSCGNKEQLLGTSTKPKALNKEIPQPRSVLFWFAACSPRPAARPPRRPRGVAPDGLRELSPDARVWFGDPALEPSARVIRSPRSPLRRAGFRFQALAGSF